MDKNLTNVLISFRFCMVYCLLTAKVCVLQWEPEDGFPSSRSRNIGEEMLYDNAGLYDNLPSPKIFARYPPADRKTNRLSTDKLSSNHYKHPVSSNLSSAQSVTNTSAVGRGSVSQVLYYLILDKMFCFFWLLCLSDCFLKDVGILHPI